MTSAMSEDDVIALAAKHGLGRAMNPIGLQTGAVFATEQGYRTGALLAFAQALVATAQPVQADAPTRSQNLAAAGFARRPSLWAMQAREALELIAAPMRPDGTWNRDREACRQLAAEALGRYDDEGQAPAAEAVQPVPRTLLEQYDLDQSPEYRKGYQDGRLKGYEVGRRHATKAAQPSSPEIPDKSPALAVRLTDEQMAQAIHNGCVQWGESRGGDRDTHQGRAVERAVWAANGLRGE